VEPAAEPTELGTAADGGEKTAIGVRQGRAQPALNRGRLAEESWPQLTGRQLVAMRYPVKATPIEGGNHRTTLASSRLSAHGFRLANAKTSLDAGHHP
jgi:hypothetical protein